MSRRIQKLVGAAVGLLALTAVGVRFYLSRSALTIVYAGGSASSPRVLATTVALDRQSNTTKAAQAELKLLVFAPEDPALVGTISVPGAPQPAGGRGSKLWMTVQQTPFLVDLATAKVVHSIGGLEERHVPLANGFKTGGPNHSEFSRNFDPESGSIKVQAANGIAYLLSPGGALTPWDAFVAEHPGRDEPVCRGGRSRVCGTERCVKFEPDPAGGLALAIGGGPKTATRAGAMLGPKLVSNEGCVRGLGEDGMLVANHQKRAGKNQPLDQISAIDRDANTVWTVELAQLFGDRTLHSHTIGVGDGVVVVGAVVGHWLYGRTVVVATIEPDGTPHPA